VTVTYHQKVFHAKMTLLATHPHGETTMTNLIVPTKSDCALDHLLSENMQLEAQVTAQEQTIAQLTTQLDRLALLNVDLSNRVSRAKAMLRVQGQELTQRRCAIKDLQIERDRLQRIVKSYDALMLAILGIKLSALPQPAPDAAPAP